jgi:hypothetical protein
MAGPTSTTIVWRVRIGGSDTNGGGVDSSIVVTDYSQQDAAQLSLADITCANTTTVTSAVGGFTAAMVGNAIWLTGGGATAGAYIITARASTNSITVDRSPGTIAAGGGKVGGAWAHPALNPSTQINDGQSVGIRGRGVNWPQGTADYTIVGYYQFPKGGSVALGAIKFFGENGRPNISTDGLVYYIDVSNSRVKMDGLYFSFRGQLYPNHGAFSCGNGVASSVAYAVTNCTFELVAYDTVACLGGNGSYICAVVEGCEFFGSGSAGAVLANPMYRVGPYGSTIRNNFFRDSRAPQGIYGGSICHVSLNVVVNIKGSGIYSADGTSAQKQAYLSNTIWGCGINLEITTSAVLDNAIILSNITGNAVNYGLKIDGGTSTLNSNLSTSVDYNFFYNNANDRLNISAGAHDTMGVNPSFVNSVGTGVNNQYGGYDFTPSSAVVGTGLLSLFGSAAGFAGAVPPASSGGAIIVNKTTNLFLEAEMI